MGLKRYGAMIRAARERRGIEQREIGDVLGVTRAAVSHCEQGRYDIAADADRMEALLSALPELTYSALMEALAEDTPDDPAPRKKKRAGRGPIGARDVMAGRYGGEVADVVGGNRPYISEDKARLMVLVDQLQSDDVKALVEAAQIMKSPRGARTELRFIAAQDGVISLPG